MRWLRWLVRVERHRDGPRLWLCGGWLRVHHYHAGLGLIVWGASWVRKDLPDLLDALLLRDTWP